MRRECLDHLIRTGQIDRMQGREKREKMMESLAALMNNEKVVFDDL